jgi:hypothetical protein
MKEILKRLKSPVVIAQLTSIVGSIFVTLYPENAGAIQEIVYALTIIINVFAGLNNPTDQKNF